MPEAGNRRSTMGFMPGVQAAREQPASPEALALNYLRELSNVLRTRGNIVTTPEGRHLYAHEFHWNDLKAPPSFEPLHEALAAANLTRCSPEDGLEALVNSWLSGRDSPESMRLLVSRWFRGITATTWDEYDAVGFENLRVDRVVRLSNTVSLMPSWNFQHPWSNGPNRSIEEIQTYQVKTWAVSHIKTTSRYPMTSIKHFPFPHALEDALVIYFTPLLKADYHVSWDGPFSVKKPFYFDQRESRTGVAVVDQKSGRVLRRLYADATQRHGRDYWAGTRGFRAKPERVRTALTYLIQAGRDANVFTSHVTLATCLEALLAPGDNQELSHRVSERAAVLVGVDDEDVYDVWRHVRSLYDLRSKELHTGQVLETQAKDIRKWTQPRLRNSSPRWNGAVFVAPLVVSLEIGRRAVAAALNIERARPSDTFDANKLDGAILRHDVRAKLRRLRGQTGSTPIRTYMAEVERQDGIRLWGTDSADSATD